MIRVIPCTETTRISKQEPHRRAAAGLAASTWQCPDVPRRLRPLCPLVIQSLLKSAFSCTSTRNNQPDRNHHSRSVLQTVRLRPAMGHGIGRWIMSSHKERYGARQWTESNTPQMVFGRSARAGSTVNDMIGRRLRSNYDSAAQPLSDRLSELLEELKRIPDSAMPEH